MNEEKFIEKPKFEENETFSKPSLNSPIQYLGIFGKKKKETIEEESHCKRSLERQNVDSNKKLKIETTVENYKNNDK